MSAAEANVRPTIQHLFERILVQQHRPDPTDAPLDLGALVEAMVFYGRTDILLAPGVLSQMARAWTVEGVIELITEGHLHFLAPDAMFGVFTQTLSDGREFYSPERMTVHPAPGLPAVGFERYLPRIVEEVVGRRGRARRLTARLTKHIEPLAQLPESASRARTDMLDNAFTNAVVADLLKLVAPAYQLPEPLVFVAVDTGERLRVETNIDFAAANRAYRALVPPEHSTLTPAYLLANILSARSALDTAAALNAELTLDPRHATAAIRRTELLFGSDQSSSQPLRLFQEFVLSDAAQVREVVNRGERDIRDILKLLDHARKFRAWVGTQPNAEQMLRNCYRDSVKSTWADRLPTKSARWMLFSAIGLGVDAAGAGGLGSAMGLATGAVDTFLVDRLIAGWKPSHFIEDRLRPFATRPAV